MTRILLVEDEEKLARFVELELAHEGYEVERVADGRAGVERALGDDFDLVLLDILLPKLNGMEVLRRVRREKNVPIIMLTARDAVMDKVAGLDAGADDYVTKPFAIEELLARVRTAIRHTRTTSANSEIAREGTYTVGEMTIDYNKHQVLVRGENVHLTLSEFRIVALLGKFAGKVLTYDYIIKELWGPRAGGDNQILRVNMANIRRKIEKNPAEPEYLFTEVGVGYRMAENTDN